MDIENLSSRFITFEGIENTGKSTHSKLIVDFLSGKGIPVILVREPGGTLISEKIRDILLDTGNLGMSDKCELFLYMASRAELMCKVIKPQLQKGKVVICDRFLDASISYQGYGNGMDLSMIEKMGDYAIEGINPGLTVFLNVDVKESLNNIDEPDRIEQRNLKYYEKVKNGYLELSKKYPDRIKTVTRRNNINDTQKEIQEIISSFLNIT